MRLHRDDLGRLVLSWAGATVTLWLVDALLPGLTFKRWYVAALVALVAGIVGVLARPVLIGLAARLGWLAVILCAAVGEAVILGGAMALVPGVEVQSGWTLIATAWLAGLVGTLLAWIASAGTDEGFATALVRRRAGARYDADGTDGVLVVQLDGVPYPVLQWALSAGNAPTLSRWLRQGTHTLHEWRPVVPCTTPASQLGVLHGASERVPAFRWWDRELGRVLTANRPPDAAVIEARATQPALLAGGGVSVSNLFSGGADRTAMVLSRLRGRGTVQTREAVAWFVVRPDGLIRSLARTVAEVIRERFQAARQRRLDLRPRVHRGWVFAVLRAATNGVIRDLSTAVVATEVLRGAPIVYVDYVDYDEVAHHAGMFRRESLAALEAVDGVLGTLERIVQSAARRYHIVVLSDHGQSQGDTFEQRTGETLGALVTRLSGSAVTSVEQPVEQYSRVRALAEDLAGGGIGSKSAARAASRLDASTPTHPPSDRKTTATGKEAELLVLGSGNLGLIYARDAARLHLDEIDRRWPALVPGLIAQPAIGVVVAMTSHGPIAVGRDGVVDLRSGSVEGVDPLLQYGEGACERLIVPAEQPEAPDLYVISACDPHSGEVYAFEGLVGSHGGLGGWQDRAILVCPTELGSPSHVLVGADAVHELILGWRRALGHRVNSHRS